MATEVTETIDKKVEAPERIWVQVYRNSFAAYDQNPLEVHDNGKPVYEYIPATPNTRQRAERAARRIYTELLGSNFPSYEPAIVDIIAAEFERW